MKFYFVDKEFIVFLLKKDHLPIVAPIVNVVETSFNKLHGIKLENFIKVLTLSRLTTRSGLDDYHISSNIFQDSF